MLHDWLSGQPMVCKNPSNDAGKATKVWPMVRWICHGGVGNKPKLLNFCGVED
jgi:hypothetical protein